MSELTLSHVREESHEYGGVDLVKVQAELAARVDELAESSPLRARVDALARTWVDSRRLAPMGFLVELSLFEHIDEHLYFVAEQRGELVGFLSAVPVHARRGWLFEDLLRARRAPKSHVVVAGNDPSELVPLEEVERRYILRVVEAVGGNKTAAARVLGLERKTLYRKLERYGFEKSTTSPSGPHRHVTGTSD